MDPTAIVTIIVLTVLISGLVVYNIRMSIKQKKSGRADYKQKSRKESSTPATSRSMTDELNRERKREGKSSIRPINPGLAGSTNTYARQDKGYSSTPDFFIKLFKRK